MLDMTGLDDGFPVIGEIPKCSDILVSSSSPVMSSIFSHLNSTGHSANFDDFEILSSCSDTCELMIHESLLISKLKPSLNVQGSSIPLNLL